MNEHDPAAYGRHVGTEYDELYPEHEDTSSTIDFLADLADGGAVLEFGVGTGRLVLPLASRGMSVAGIEGSAVMAGQLRAKPRGADVNVVIGDFSRERVPGQFALVALVYNTIFALPSRVAQSECFRNAAIHLVPSGVFVVEAFVLRQEEMDGRWQLRPRSVRPNHVELQLGRYIAEHSLYERQLIHLLPTGTRFVPVNDLYASPSQLDELASEAGFELSARWAGWSRQEYTSTSDRHVSVYQLARKPN